MTNAELIKALRCEGDCGDCAYYEESLWWRRCDELGMRRDAADALEAADKRIARLEAQMPKDCEFKSYADKIPNARNRYCTQCGAYLRDEEFENHAIRYCYWCGSKVKGEKTDGSV